MNVQWPDLGVLPWVQNRGAGGIAAGYIGFGTLWILFSDRFAQRLATTQAQLSAIQTGKGWLFIALSGMFIYAVVSIRDRALDASNRRLARQSQYLQVFNRILRHNVRNELNVISGRVSTAEAECEGANELLDDLDAINSATDRILRVAEKARQLDRFDPNADPETVDVGPEIADVVDRFRDAYPAAVFHTEVSGAVYIRTTDTILLAIEELIENAIEHNDRPPKEREVTVRVTSSLMSRATIEVEDNGPGIPETEIRPLERGLEDQGEHASSIGLWLVQWVVDDHRGDLTIESDTDGTRVCMEMPQVTLRQAQAELVSDEG